MSRSKDIAVSAAADDRLRDKSVSTAFRFIHLERMLVDLDTGHQLYWGQAEILESRFELARTLHEIEAAEMPIHESVPRFDRPTKRHL